MDFPANFRTCSLMLRSAFAEIGLNWRTAKSGTFGANFLGLRYTKCQLDGCPRDTRPTNCGCNIMKTMFTRAKNGVYIIAFTKNRAGVQFKLLIPSSGVLHVFMTFGNLAHNTASPRAPCFDAPAYFHRQQAAEHSCCCAEGDRNFWLLHCAFKEAGRLVPHSSA